MYAPPRQVSDPRTDRALTVLAAITCLEQSGCGEEAVRRMSLALGIGAVSLRETTVQTRHPDSTERYEYKQTSVLSVAGVLSQKVRH